FRPQGQRTGRGRRTIQATAGHTRHALARPGGTGSRRAGSITGADPVNISAPFNISEKEDLSGGGRALDLSLVSTFIVVAVDATGMGIILPLLPFYSQRLGATPFLVGALVSVYAVCQLMAGPIVGILSDRYGRRKVLLVSQIGTLAGFVVLALAPNLTLVFLARIIDGLTSGNISVWRMPMRPSTRRPRRGN